LDTGAAIKHCRIRGMTMAGFDETLWPASKRVGATSEVTLIAPIKAGRIEGEYRTYRKRLEGVLDSLQQREAEGRPTPISFLRQIHFARWVILDPPDGGRPLLIFTSNFDGDMRSYFRSFSLSLTEDINAVWQNCEGYPEEGARDFDRLWQYVKEHQRETRAFYGAYRTLTVPQILKLEEFKRDFDAFIAGVGDVLRSGAESDSKIVHKLKRLLAETQPRDAPGRRSEASRRARPINAAGSGSRRIASSDIQANILASPPWKRAAYLFLSIGNPDLFRTSLARLVAQGFLTAADVANAKGDSRLSAAFNVAFTWLGLERLGLAPEHLGALPLAFRQGMAARASMILGDVGESAPDRWDAPLGCGQIHAVIAAFAMEEAIDGCLAQFGALEGCVVLHREIGIRKTDRHGYPREHFGFRDGIGQPEVADPGAPRDKNGRYAVPLGEFVMGYDDADGNDQIAEALVGPNFRALCENGTFMVFRKLEQDVGAFNKFVRRNGGAAFASMLVGRTKDGMPLAASTKWNDQYEKAAGDEDRRERLLDDFTYRSDPHGEKCPFASHVRRVNPRDGIAATELRRHRIIRRGIPYEQEDKRGLLFVCFNTRIDSQFEFLQSEWCNKGDFQGHFTDVRDPIVGGGGAFVGPQQPAPVADLKRFVTVKGGEYLFVPGIRALDGILHGSFDMPSTNRGEARTTSEEPPEVLDPVLYAASLGQDRQRLQELWLTGEIVEKRISWASGKQQSLHYVACRDQIGAILKDETRFTSAHYARRMERLLDGYDPREWLREDERPGPESLLLRRALLGMPFADPEKQARLAILRRAVIPEGEIDAAAAARHLAQHVKGQAEAVVQAAIEKSRGCLDVVQDLAYAIPVGRAIGYLGLAEPAGRPQKFSDAYTCLYFARRSIDDVRRMGWSLTQKYSWREELLGLVRPITLFLLVDNYDTPESLTFARITIAELLNTLAQIVIQEEIKQEREEHERQQPAARRDTLLSRMVAQRPRTAATAAERLTFRLRVGMILAELIVGGTDTAAKATVNLVDYLLSHADVMKAATPSADDDALAEIILESLRLAPVAPIMVRECSANTLLLGASNRPEHHFEAGSRLFLLTGAAACEPPAEGNFDLSRFNIEPKMRALLQPIRQLSFGDGPHSCLGRELVVAELLTLLKALIVLPGLRRAAGPSGEKREQFGLPVSLTVCFEPPNQHATGPRPDLTAGPAGVNPTTERPRQSPTGEPAPQRA
jgi:Dyp-type peroxidase family